MWSKTRNLTIFSFAMLLLSTAACIKKDNSYEASFYRYSESIRAMNEGRPAPYSDVEEIALQSKLKENPKVEFLGKQLKNHSDPVLQETAMLLLSQVGKDELLAALPEILSQGSESLAPDALRYLVENDKANAPRIIGRLIEEDKRRKVVMYALAISRNISAEQRKSIEHSVSARLKRETQIDPAFAEELRTKAKAAGLKIN